MARIKGTPKTGGRQPGTENKLTKELRTVLKNIMFEELENLPVNLNKLDNKDRIEILVKLIPYVLPKVETVPIDKGEPFHGGWD
jgi:hypothetical protein